MATGAGLRTVKWLKINLAPILTSITLLIAMGAAYGRLDRTQQLQADRQAELSRSLSVKVDRDQVLRELDQVHRSLADIQKRLDGVIVRQAIITE